MSYFDQASIDQLRALRAVATFTMEFQHLHSRTTAKLLLRVGSLLVLADEARYLWTHQIRARIQDRGVPRRRRVSLTFRKVVFSA